MKLKVGIIGCGSITRYRHAPEYKENPHVGEIVFYDRNPERSEAMAADFGGTAVETVEELFNDPDITAISDCSSNESHHIFSTQALQNGKHVLCEKPIALTLDDASKMVDAQKQSGKKLMLDHNQRLTAAHQRAKTIIESKELGEVLSFKTTFGHGGPEHWGINKTPSTWFFKKERSGLGVAGDLGIHKIDLIHYLLDDEVEQLSAFADVLHKKNEYGEPIDVCDNIVSSLKTKRGRLGTASFSWTYYGEEDNSTTIYCEKGILKVYHDPDYQLDVITADNEKVRYQLEAMQTNDNQTNTGVIDNFIDAIQFDRKPIVSGEEALSSIQVILGILEAARTNKVLSI